MMKKLLFLFVLAVMTVCHVNAQRFFFEDFNQDTSSTAVPAGWTVYGDTLTNHGNYSQYNQSWQVWFPGGSDRSGEAMSVTFTVDTWEPCDRWLITPRIALPADSTAVLLFSHYGMGLGQPSVKLSTTGTDPADFTTLLGHITTQSYRQQVCFSLASYAGDSVYIAFVNDVVHANGHCSQFVALDDIEVKYLPQNSIALTEVVMPQQAVVGQPVTATLKVTNLGSNHVGTMTYSYQVGANAPEEHTATVNLWPCHTVSRSVTFVPTELGEDTIVFQVGMPNGTEDFDSTDNRKVLTMTVVEPSEDPEDPEEPPLAIRDAGGHEPVTVYPNPFQDKVTIRTEADVAAAWLTDMSGHREDVRLVPQGGGVYVLDLAARPRGAYFLILATANGRQHTLRLIKLAEGVSR